MRALVIALLLLAPLHGFERWVYLPANFQVDAETDRVCALLARARKAGYDHALVADSKFARLGTVIDRYFANVRRVRAAADDLGIAMVPALFPVGYSNDLLFHDPNLAEGLPVKDALFVVRDGIAHHTPDPPVALADGDMTNRKAWQLADDCLVADAGAMRSSAPTANSRLSQSLTVTPFRQYHVSVRIKTRGFGGGAPEIKALTADGRSLQWTNLRVGANDDWSTHHVTFNSLGYSKVKLYFGVWGGHRGDLWWDDATIEECGLVNLLRRPGTPLTVRREDGPPLAEGRDFEPPADPLLGSKPWPGEYTAWHEPPPLRTHRLADGTRLRVSFHHPHIIYDGQVCACVEEPAFQNLLADQAKRVTALWQARGHLMSHDEWRVLGWDQSCLATGRTPGQIAAANVRLCTKLLRTAAPDARILVWSDMFDPHHNAIDDYYLVNGSLKQAWDGLDPKVVIMNWNFGHRDESLRFFAARGHHQVIAGYYDGPLDQVARWLDSARKVDGVDGFMYTTWRGDYSQLEAVAKMLP